MNFDLPELRPEAPAGMLCQVKVRDLKPTQSAVGFDEVNDKFARYSVKSKADLRDYLLVHLVPVVIGNRGQFNITHRPLVVGRPLSAGVSKDPKSRATQRQTEFRNGGAHGPGG